MRASHSILSLALHILGFLHLANGSVFITHPFSGITCKGGQNCTVTWVDDGQAPLLNAIGPCDFGLYEGSADTLVQEIALGLDVSQVRTLTFKVDAATGPNSDSYYIGAIATTAKNSTNSSEPYMSFSGRFTMSQMSGKSNSPDPFAVSSPAVNPKAVATQSNGVVGTTTLALSSTTSLASSSSSRRPSSSSLPATNNNTSTTSLLSKSSIGSSSSSSTVTPIAATGALAPSTVSTSRAKRRFSKDLKDCVRGGAMVLGAIVFSGGTLL